MRYSTGNQCNMFILLGECYDPGVTIRVALFPVYSELQL